MYIVPGLLRGWGCSAQRSSLRLPWTKELSGLCAFRKLLCLVVYTDTESVSNQDMWSTIMFYASWGYGGVFWQKGWTCSSKKFACTYTCSLCWVWRHAARCRQTLLSEPKKARALLTSAPARQRESSQLNICLLPTYLELYFLSCLVLVLGDGALLRRQCSQPPPVHASTQKAVHIEPVLLAPRGGASAVACSPAVPAATRVTL